ncbi:MAG: helix-turn-helix domain-containing protein [Candidatus Thorarchaeota archaeon]
MEFKKILQNEFLESKLGRQDFAKKIGVSRKTLNKYLAGDSSPTFERAQEILKNIQRQIIIVRIYDYNEWFGDVCEECKDKKALPNNTRCKSCLVQAN